jgi:predicted lipoprotein with Yx(FWY)xxD motif
VLRDRGITGAVGVVAAVLALAACGGSGYPDGVRTGTTQNKPAEDRADADNAENTKPVGNVVTSVVGKKVPEIGNVVMDSKGWIFYRFDEDSAKPATSNCSDDCAKLWPPVLTKNGKDLPDLKGIDPEKVGTIKRDDGGWQLTIGDWPVYRYIGDEEPGTWEGQGVSGNWFVVTKDGKKNLKELPKGTPKPVSLPDDSDESSTKSDDSSNTGDESEDDGYGDGGYGGY